MYWNKITPENVFFTLIDFQSSFFNILDQDVVKLSRSNIILMIKIFKMLGIPMVGTDHYRKGLGLTDADVLGEWSGPEFTDKVTFSCCGHDAFMNDVKTTTHNRPMCIVAGLETHICVLQTTMDFLSKGYEVLVVKDACLSSTKLRWENGIELMKEAGAKIVNTETLIFQLLRRVDRPEFKALVKLLKEQKEILKNS